MNVMVPKAPKVTVSTAAIALALSLSSFSVVKRGVAPSAVFAQEPPSKAQDEAARKGVNEKKSSFLTPRAARVERSYLHLSSGKEYGQARLIRQINDKGQALYSSKLGGAEESLLADAQGRPLEYTYSLPNGYRGQYVFAPDHIVSNRQAAGKEPEEFRWAPSPGARPDFNSRPDPYLTQHLLIQGYDLAARGKQALLVYDLDDKGTGIREYKITLELVDEDGVALPNGKFKAKHFVQVQQTGGGTWYKKRRGSQTDIWVNDDLVILRIYRHREPYEVIVQEYDNAQDLMSPVEKAQVYPKPRQVEPDPLPRLDVSQVPGELVFEGAYQHRNRGYDWFVGRFFVKRQGDGAASYIAEFDNATYIAVADKNNVPIEYRCVSREDPNSALRYAFAGNKVVSVRKGDKPEEERSEHTVSHGCLPDFNSRPDPYCIQHVLLRRYDLAKRGRQTLTVFDGDSAGKGISEYQIALDYVGDEDIIIPAGKFKAKHLVLTQLTPSNTWYKKYQGLQTDFWFGDDYAVYRILRKREPYEVVLVQRTR